MARRAPLTLDGMKAAKSLGPVAADNGGAIAAATRLPPNKASDGRRGQTLRLNTAAWRELKYLAADRECTAHQLLIEAVNDLLEKHGRPPVA